MAFPERRQADSVAFAFRVRFTAGAVFGEGGLDLLTVDRLGDRRATVPDQVADVLQPDIVCAQDGHERVPQFAGRPRPAEPRGPGDLLELLPYLPAV